MKENTFLVAKLNKFGTYLQQSCQSNDYWHICKKALHKLENTP
jgi:hypothetical protein